MENGGRRQGRVMIGEVAGMAIHTPPPPSYIAIHRKFQTRRAAEGSTWLYGEAAQHRMRLSVDGYMYQRAVNIGGTTVVA